MAIQKESDFSRKDGLVASCWLRSGERLFRLVLAWMFVVFPVPFLIARKGSEYQVLGRLDVFMLVIRIIKVQIIAIIYDKDQNLFYTCRMS